MSDPDMVREPRRPQAAMARGDVNLREIDHLALTRVGRSAFADRGLRMNTAKPHVDGRRG
jgi:hypothetical protein